MRVQYDLRGRAIALGWPAGQITVIDIDQGQSGASAADRDGADVAAMMPRLSTYLGHTDPKHTYWYLSAAPELMALAGDRLHAHLQGES